MCELTFVDLGTTNMNRLALTTMGIINSRKIHNDGVGIFQYQKGTGKTTLFKTELAPVNITNWGYCVRNAVISRDPAFMHVRNATMNGNTNKRIVEAEKSHPFVTKKFVLAHNGTLDMRLAADEDKYKGEELIDSELFVKELDKAYKGIEFKDAIVKAMKKFYGKFAFIIFERGSKEYYIVRGDSKVLHKVDIFEETDKLDDDGEPIQKHIGVIINTEKDDLYLGVQTFLQNAQWMYKKKLSMGDIEELDKETIYKYSKKTLSAVGEIKEIEKWHANARNVNKNNHYQRPAKPFLQSSPPPPASPRQPKLIEEIERHTHYMEGEELEVYAQETGLTHRELDQLSFELFGNTMLELGSTEADVLIHQVMPVLSDRTTEKKLSIWKLITLAIEDWPDAIYHSHPELRYPYMMNGIDELILVAKTYVEETDIAKVYGI